MRLTIIANPVAGRGRPFKKVQRHVRNWPHCDWHAELIPTRGPEHAGIIAREVMAHPPDLLAICGGDGTMKEVVTSVPDPSCPIALLPAGTANVLAREFKLPLDPVQAIEVALRGKVCRVDLGSIKSREDHHFLLMTGVGFDASAAASVRPALKKRLGIIAYYLAVAQGLLNYNFNEFDVIVAGMTSRAASCVIANSRGYGGGLHLTPTADMTDGKLDVLVIQRASRLEYARFIFASRLGTTLKYPFLNHFQAASIRVEGPRGIWVQADGEPVGTLPIDVDVYQGKFPLVVPP